MNACTPILDSKGSQLTIESSSSEGAPVVHVNVRTTMRLLHPQALERSLFMAHDELRVVGELNVEDIRLHSDRYMINVLMFVYLRYMF